MKPKSHLVLEMCIKNGLDYGWVRAHKHFETPPENIIKQEIEEAIWHEVWEWFDMGEEHMSNTAKIMEIAGEVVRKGITEKIEREWVPLTVEEPYNGWILRNVYFEDGEPLMHSEPESTQSQELFGKTERLEAENKRLQEREWVGLTDEDIAELRRNGAHSVSDADFQTIEAKLKEKNCA
jgi:hypothetical protein